MTEPGGDLEAWITGATGLVGRALVAELCRRSTSGNVTALVRRIEGRKEPRLEERVVAFERLELELLGRSATHAFCCLGTTMARAGSEAAFRRVDYDYPLAFGRAARTAGVRKFLVVTAIGADPKSNIFYNRVKGELEEAVRALGFGATHIFRPSFLAGDRGESRMGEKAGIFAARVLATVLPIGPVRRARPIEASDVAGAMVSIAKRGERGFFVHESDRIQALADSSKESD